MTKKTTAAPEDGEASQTLGVLWGAQAIADFIGRPVRDAYYLLQQGHIDADKCGDLWVTTKSRLRRQFNGEGPRQMASRDIKVAATALDELPTKVVPS